MSPVSESLDCFGKINLFLEIQDHRPDGFHNLGTLFQTVACGDRLTATISESGAGDAPPSLELECPQGITDSPEQNLVIRAARLLLETCADRVPKHTGMRFTLEKRLPAGAGLGGGSSDAAGALVLCNRLWNLGLSREELMGYGARLGADVPFFLFGGSAFGEGKGEILSPAPAPYPFHVVIGTPQCKVETGWAYSQLDPDRKRRWDRFKALYVTYCEDPGFYRILDNDFHALMHSRFPPIQAVAEDMQSFGPVKTLLTGSGASVFALFEEKSRAESCLEAIRSQCRFSCLTGFVE